MIRSVLTLAFWRSPALGGALFFAVSGLGFSVGSLLLARVLPKAELGLVMLAVALVSLGIQFAPLGSDGVVNRRPVDFGAPLLWRVVATSIVAGLVFFVIGDSVYDLAWSMSLLVLIGVIAGGVSRVAAAKFQSLQRFSVALAIFNVMSLAIVLAGILAVVLRVRDPLVPVALVVLGCVVAAGLGWGALFRRRAGEPGPFEPFGWGEALSYAGVHVAGVVLTQLDRLLIPKLLSLEDLATFAVLASVTIAPFRMLQLGVGYTILPRMRGATSISARRHLLLQEMMVTGVVVVVGVVAVWLLAPIVVHLVLEDRYVLSPALIAAALVSGTIRVFTGFTRATVSALCTNRELAYLGALMWLMIACAVAGAAVGSPWGLVGVIYGASLGWLGQLVISASIAIRHLRADSQLPDGDARSA